MSEHEEKGQSGWPGSMDALPSLFTETGRRWLAGGGEHEEIRMELMTRFALILFVRMIAHAEQAMLMARNARAEVSGLRGTTRSNEVGRG